LTFRTFFSTVRAYVKNHNLELEVLPAENGRLRVKVNGMDVFHPNTCEVRSDNPEGIACWFIDTDYNMASFFVRHAYFLGANDPYSAIASIAKAAHSRGGAGDPASTRNRLEPMGWRGAGAPRRRAAPREHRRGCAAINPRMGDSTP